LTELTMMLHSTHARGSAEVFVTYMDKKLIRRWDSERELFYDDIVHRLQSTIDLGINYQLSYISSYCGGLHCLYNVQLVMFDLSQKVQETKCSYFVDPNSEHFSYKV